MRRSIDPDSLDALLAQICHLHYCRAQQLFEAIGLYRGQPRVLDALWEQDGLTHTELAERLQVTQATITKMLQRMEKAGLLRRKPDAEDLRVSRVFLTETGRGVQAEIQAAWQQSEQETFARFSPEERILLRRFLLDIRENLLRAVGEQL